MYEETEYEIRQNDKMYLRKESIECERRGETMREERMCDDRRQNKMRKEESV